MVIKVLYEIHKWLFHHCQMLTYLNREENILQMDTRLSIGPWYFTLKLTVAPILGNPYFNLPFTIDSDSSNVSIGAILSNLTFYLSIKTAVAYEVRTLTTCKWSYCVTRKKTTCGGAFCEAFPIPSVRKRVCCAKWIEPTKIVFQFNNPERQTAGWQSWAFTKNYIWYMYGSNSAPIFRHFIKCFMYIKLLYYLLEELM